MTEKWDIHFGTKNICIECPKIKLSFNRKFGEIIEIDMIEMIEIDNQYYYIYNNIYDIRCSIHDIYNIYYMYYYKSNRKLK